MIDNNTAQKLELALNSSIGRNIPVEKQIENYNRFSMEVQDYDSSYSNNIFVSNADKTIVMEVSIRSTNNLKEQVDIVQQLVDKLNVK